MEKRTKIIFGVVAGLAIIGTLVYFRNKKKKQQALENAKLDTNVDMDMDTDVDVKLDDKGNVTTVDMSSNSNARATYPMGYISDSGSTIHAVHLNKRPKEGTIKKGDKVQIKGTSFNNTYKVDRVWIDKNGNVGAIYLPISYKPKGKNDITFANKGVIELL